MSNKIKLMVLMLAAALCMSACSRDKEQPQRPQTAAPPAPVEMAKRPAEPPPPEILPVSGKVLEIIDAGSFIYVSVDWNGKQVWATVPGVELKVGEVISLDHATMFENFHSDALNRTFSQLIFASGVEGKSPRSRTANISANPNDPRNRRSGKFKVAPSPAPPLPTGKVSGKVG